MIDLETLLARVEVAPEPDRDIDRDIFFAFYCVPNEGQVGAFLGRAVDPALSPYLLAEEFLPTDGSLAPRFTGSIDAARDLIHHVLPGWYYRICECSVSDDAWVVPDFSDPEHGGRLLDEYGGQEECLEDPVQYFGADIAREPPGQPALALVQSLLIAVNHPAVQAARRKGPLK